MCIVYTVCPDGRGNGTGNQSMDWLRSTWGIYLGDAAANFGRTAFLFSFKLILTLHVHDSHSRHAFKVCVIKKLMLVVVFIQTGTFIGNKYSSGLGGCSQTCRSYCFVVMPLQVWCLQVHSKSSLLQQNVLH